MVRRARRVVRIIGAVGLSLSGSLWAEQAPVKDSNPPRPAQWAEVLPSENLHNFHRVSPVLFRGAQPSVEGLKELEKMGVKTVVNLRMLHSDKDEITGVKLDEKRIKFNPFHPEDEDMVKFLKIVTDPEKQPVFVHCQHGSDRTGTACALYRMAVQGWSKEDAIKEMREGGYGFHEDYFENLLEYLHGVDIESLRKKAKLPPAPVTAAEIAPAAK